MERTEVEQIGVKIPKALLEKVAQAIARGEYLNVSDLTRAALRKLLEEEAGPR